MCDFFRAVQGRESVKNELVWWVVLKNKTHVNDEPVVDSEGEEHPRTQLGCLSSISHHPYIQPNPPYHP